MAGPWEKYQSSSQPETGPWTKYAAPPPSAPTEQPRSVSDKLGDFGSEWWKQVNPVSGVQGLAEAARHPIDTASNLLDAQGQLALKVKDALGRRNFAEAGRHALNYMIPVLGPQIDAAGDLADKGELAKSAGMTAGIATNIAAPELLKGANFKVPVGGLPERLYKSALKPSTTLRTGEAAKLVDTGLTNNIPVSAEGIDKLNGLVKNLNDSIKSTIQSGAQSGATINKFTVASRLGDTAKKFTNQVNPASDMNAIAASGREFLANQPTQIPVDAAQALKQGTYSQLKSKAYGKELGSATVEAQKALARGIKEELESQFPEIKQLNAKEGALIGLNKSLDRAVRRIDNHQLFGIGTPIATAAGGVVTGSPVGAAAAGIMKLILDNPEFKSQLAIVLKSASKGSVPISATAARLAAYSNALGNAMPDGSQTQPEP